MVAEKTLEEQLAHLPGLPVKVVKWEIERGLDSTNDPAVWVWMTLAEWPEFEVRQRARELVGTYVRENAPIDYVYVRFLDANEPVYDGEETDKEAEEEASV